MGWWQIGPPAPTGDLLDSQGLTGGTGTRRGIMAVKVYRGGSDISASKPFHRCWREVTGMWQTREPTSWTVQSDGLRGPVDALRASELAGREKCGV